MKILLVLTFVYGVLKLLSHTKIFNTHLVGILRSIMPVNEKNSIYGLITWIDILFFYFSLCYQSYYWLFKNI